MTTECESLFASSDNEAVSRAEIGFYGEDRDLISRTMVDVGKHGQLTIPADLIPEGTRIIGIYSDQGITFWPVEMFGLRGDTDA